MTTCMGVKSKARIIHTGVQQGSKLSPTLFSFHIADMPRPTEPVRRICYADDIIEWNSGEINLGSRAESQHLFNVDVPVLTGKLAILRIHVTSPILGERISAIILTQQRKQWLSVELNRWRSERIQCNF